MDVIQQHCAMFIGCLCQRLQAAGICCAHGSEQDVFSCLQKFAHLPEIQTAVIRKIYDVCFLQSSYPQSSYLQSPFLQGAFLQIQVLTPGRCLQKGAAFLCGSQYSHGYHGHFSHGHSSISLSDSLFTFCWLYGITKIDGIIRILWDFF